MAELKPCPFCGKKARLRTRADKWLTEENEVYAARNQYLIYCTHCRGQIDWKLSEIDAAKAWNRRGGLD